MSASVLRRDWAYHYCIATLYFNSELSPPYVRFLFNLLERITFGGGRSAKFILNSGVGFFPSVALAEEDTSNFYVAGKLGASLMDIDDIKNTSGVANPARMNVGSEENTIFAAGVAAGYDWFLKGAPIRTEAEYMFRSAFDYDPNPTFVNAGTPTRADTEIITHTFLVNAFYDFKTETKFTPYIGGGLGFSVKDVDGALITLSTGAVSNDDHISVDFVWNIGGGIGYAINKRLSLDFGFRYLELQDVGYGDPAAFTAFEHNSHEFLLGLRHQF